MNDDNKDIAWPFPTGNKPVTPTPALTEERVREIVREEIARVLSQNAHLGD